MIRKPGKLDPGIMKGTVLSFPTTSTTSLQWPYNIQQPLCSFRLAALSSTFIIFHLQFAASSGELFVMMAFAHLHSELLPKPSAQGKVLPQARCSGT